MDDFQLIISNRISLQTIQVFSHDYEVKCTKLGLNLAIALICND